MTSIPVHGGDPWPSMMRRLEELKAVLPSLADLPDPSPQTACALLERLASAVEDLRRRGIRDQIQLASVQEITETLLSVRNSEEVLATLTSYLRQVLDLEEILLLRRLPRQDVCSAFHAGGRDRHARYFGEVAWRAEWDEEPSDDRSEVRPSDDRSEVRPSDDRSEACPTDGRDPHADRGDRLYGERRRAEAGPLATDRYAITLRLGGHARSADRCGACEAPDEASLGLLCATPRGGAGADLSPPLEVAARVEGILRSLRHREELEAEARFRRQLLRSMVDGLLALDAGGAIVELNASAARLLGLTAEEGIGAPLSLLDAIDPGLHEHLERAFSLSEDAPAREMVIRAAGGSVPVNVAVSILRDEQGSRAGLVVNLTDLTAIRAMEEEIRRLDRFAALGRFAAGVAHEIRNPLAGIGAGVEYIAGRLLKEAPEQEDLMFLRKEIRRLDRIVSEMLDYTRPRPIEPQAVEAGPILRRVRQLVAPLLSDRGVEIDLWGEAGLPLWADPDRLEQVLLNLVKNAVEASPSGARVRLAWECGDEGVRVCVEDRGSGMGKEERSRAFEPFYTTKSTGTGLGLALSHAIVEQHGGRLRLESREGGGTVAVLELPGRPDEARSHARSEHAHGDHAQMDHAQGDHAQMDHAQCERTRGGNAQSDPPKRDHIQKDQQESHAVIHSDRR